MSELAPKIYSTVTEGLARLFGTPPYLILFVSDSCWMSCGHCWFTRQWKERRLQGARLEVADYERLARSIRWLAFLSITGGEAFARPDLLAIVRAFVRGTRLARYQIPTSGYLTDTILQSTEQLLREHRRLPFRVDVSLDGTRDTHDAIRGVTGGFERACATIRELNRLCTAYPWFDVGVISTISRQNQSEVAELAQVVDSVHPLGEWMVNLIRGEPRDPTATDVSLEAYREAHELIRLRPRRHRGHFGAGWLSAKNVVRRRMILENAAGAGKGGGCAAGSLAGVIHTDGSVWSCEMLEESLGNLKDYEFDLRRLWESEPARRQRRWIQDSRCQCTQECFLSMSMLIRPECWVGMVGERLRMARGES